MKPKQTCRGVLRGPFHCLCWRGTRGHKSGLCPMHRKAVEAGEAAEPDRALPANQREQREQREENR
jgi:hypothetical protein